MIRLGSSRTVSWTVLRLPYLLTAKLLKRVDSGFGLLRGGGLRKSMLAFILAVMYHLDLHSQLT